jgi:hypothetical protein
MRTIFRHVPMLMTSAFIISCTPAAPIKDRDAGNMTLSICTSSCNGTKASSPASEEAVRSIQVLMFKDGVLYGCGAAEGPHVELMASDGVYDIYAFVNDPYDWVSETDVTEEQILSSRSMLEDNSMSSLVMFGYKHEVQVDKSTETVMIPVDRLVSKILLKEIRTDFSENPYFKGKSLKINRIYLSNIMGSCTYSLKPEGSPPPDDAWFCRLGEEEIPETLKPLTSDEGLDMTIPDGGTARLSRVFYSYPNGCISDSSSDSWEPRRTRLVIEAVLDGRECWYHITLPPMMPNVTYMINSCTIKNMGGSSPEEHLGPACEVSLTSSLSWEETYSVEEES